MGKYSIPKQFNVHLVDENGKELMHISFLAVKKINHSKFNDLAGIGVEETLVILGDSLKVE